MAAAAAAAAGRAAARSLGKLTPSDTALFVCDVQERFRPAISGYPAVIDTARRLVRGARILDVPILVTEQNPARLGSTVVELKDPDVLPADATVVPKTLFSMVTPETDTFLSRHPAVKSVLVCGIETHVCVLQTGLDLLERGFDVHVITDGVSSQRLADREAGLARLAQSGAFLASSEMVLFQLMRDAATCPGFKAVSALVREPRPDPPGGAGPGSGGITPRL